MINDVGNLRIRNKDSSYYRTDNNNNLKLPHNFFVGNMKTNRSRSRINCKSKI